MPSTTGGISPSQTTEISQSLYYEYHELITVHDCANFYLRSFISCAHYCGFPACCSYPSRFSTEGGCCGVFPLPLSASPQTTAFSSTDLNGPQRTSRRVPLWGILAPEHLKCPLHGRWVSVGLPAGPSRAPGKPAIPPSPQVLASGQRLRQAACAFSAKATRAHTDHLSSTRAAATTQQPK